MYCTQCGQKLGRKNHQCSAVQVGGAQFKGAKSSETATGSGIPSALKMNSAAAVTGAIISLFVFVALFAYFFK